LELKLLAHLGIVGCPNAGKSSLISRLSNCKPAIGDYPFTTLTPNLGILKLSDLRALTLVDVPGLIRGACAGKGLGKQFLRHIERCRALLHVLDGSLSPAELRRDLDTVRDELAAAGIFPEAVIIVVNKADTIPDLDQRSRIRDQLPGEKAAFVSSVTGEGISELLETIRQLDRSKDLTAMPAAQAATPPPTADYSAREAACVLEVPAEGVFRVRGSEVEGWARVTDTSDWQSLNQLLKVLDRLGALESLTEAGVESGDTVIVGNKEFVWSDYAQDKLV
jgi:GTP-binding protein